MKFEHEVIFCIVNAGFSDLVMDAAKKIGARGGTVIHARGTANTEAEKLFGITVQPEKEIVMILVPRELKDNILHALYREAGLESEGQGIAFALPVSAVVGLSNPEKTEPKEPPKAE
ncbi:MAG: P-II family nitrogen regulator [Clostridia bacterium]|nr:P-II family nitrogen regulator [Clostridia bacterium]